ncbi:MAG: hypothetical protein QM627_05560 [Luteolibacter sp.]
MKSWQKYLVLAVFLLAMGAVRLPVEARLTEELRSARLLNTPLPIGTREKIGQTSSAVALGGLRTLVATFLNLRAYTAFTEQRWPDVESTYDTIVELAPHTTYYWETGAWHMAYNAAPHYQTARDLSPLRRRQEWRTSIRKGRAFLERGIRNNPEDWKLYQNLGFLLADPNKVRAFPSVSESFAAAAEAYQKAADSGTMLPVIRRNQLYSLARVPGREAEALSLARKLYDERLTNRTPTLQILLVALETQQDIIDHPAQRAVELFGDETKAYNALGFYWRARNNLFPMDGIADALATLEKSLGVPPEKSILLEETPPAAGSDEWFR